MHLDALAYSLFVRMHSSTARKWSMWFSTSDLPSAARLWTMDEDVVEVCMCIRPMGPEELRHQTIEHGRCIRQPLGHDQPLPEHTSRSTDRCQRDIACSHEQLVIAIDQVERTVHRAANHVVLQNILPRNRRLCRDGGSVKLIESVNDTPLAIRVSHTEGWCRVRRLALTHHNIKYPTRGP